MTYVVIMRSSLDDRYYVATREAFRSHEQAEEWIQRQREPEKLMVVGGEFGHLLLLEDGKARRITRYMKDDHVVAVHGV